MQVGEPARQLAAAGSKLQYLEQVAKPMLHLEGNSLPVSVFSPR